MKNLFFTLVSLLLGFPIIGHGQPLKFAEWVSTTSAGPNVIASGTKGRLKKAVGAGDVWHNQHISADKISGDGMAQFTIGPGSHMAFGLVTSNATGGHGTIDFGIQINAAGTVRVFEGNTTVRYTFASTHSSFHVYAIERLGTQIRYRLNGAVVYTSTKVSSGDLYLDAGFYKPGSFIDTAMIGNEPIDVDADGMPDAWELSCLPPGSTYSDVVAFLPNGDSGDNDGLTNLQEYQNRTSPVEADSDGDGMPDGWEVTMGLNPRDASDAFDDSDHDSIPNLWKYSRGTNPILIDAIVSDRLTANPSVTPPIFNTLQEAYDSLSSDPEFRSIVQVTPGNYPASLRPGSVSKKVAWIGASGTDHPTQRAEGKRNPILRSSLSTSIDCGIIFNADTFVKGLIIDGSSFLPGIPAVSFLAPASTSTSVPELRIEGCIIRNWRANYAAESAEATGPGALLIENGICVVENSTFWRSRSTESIGNIKLSIVENRSGTCHLINSIFWDDDLSAPTPLYTIVGLENMVAEGSIIQLGELGGADVNPLLTAGGFPQLSSTAVINKANYKAYLKNFDAVNTDLFSQFRGFPSYVQPTGPPAIVPDLGAVEWVDSDSDGMADWWEIFWFGNLSQAAAGDPDSDSTTNLQEYLNDTAPTKDQDGDGLPDWWELDYFYNIYSQSNFSDPDADLRTNGVEYTGGTNPTVIDGTSIVDYDNDLMYDAWEIQHFGSVESKPDGRGDPNGDPDNDGATNLQEFNASPKTDPNLLNKHYDLDSDGIADYWEINYFGSVVACLPNANPDGDNRTNYQEWLTEYTNPYNQSLWMDPTKIDPDSTVDHDADGLLDFWEITYWNTIASQPNGGASPSGDPDRDGLTNLQEQSLGSSPIGRGTSPTDLDYNYDGDSDGIPDWWELRYFNTVLDCIPGANPDGDARTNQQEWEVAQANPNDESKWHNPMQRDVDFDSDSDGLWDSWERTYFLASLGVNYLNASPLDNPDSDGRNNLQEFLSGTNPLEIDYDWDGDNDGMPYGWESLYGLDTNIDDSELDPDGDRISNLEEYLRSVTYNRPSNPFESVDDWDQDGLIDLDEIVWFESVDAQTGTDDYDGDGLRNIDEVLIYKLDPSKADTLGLGYGDAFLVYIQYVSFQYWDLDGDGISNIDELAMGMNPLLKDSDGDGVNDNNDYYPMDPTLHVITSRPGSPIVELSLPAGAVLVP